MVSSSALSVSVGVHRGRRPLSAEARCLEPSCFCIAAVAQPVWRAQMRQESLPRQGVLQS